MALLSAVPSEPDDIDGGRNDAVGRACRQIGDHHENFITNCTFDFFAWFQLFGCSFVKIVDVVDWTVDTEPSAVKSSQSGSIPLL